MISQGSEGAEGRPLENLGISEAEERVYRWLLTHHGSSAAEIARALALAASKVQRLLDAIEAKGLATHSLERPRRYMASSPDVALEALIVQRQKGLQDAGDAVKALQAEAASHKEEHTREHIVELVASREAERQILGQMEASARDEVVALVKPPVRILRLDEPTEQEHSGQRESQTRGVRHRSVINTDYFNLRGAVQSIRSDMEAGEDVRVSGLLPLKMVMADKRIALIPLDSQQNNGPSLLIRSSDLLDALYALFESLWENAAPISFSGDDEVEFGARERQLKEETKGLISLMAAGLNDKTIAYDLDIPKRTLSRRTSEMMQALRARTRFQAGWLAALRLLGGESGLRPETAEKPDKSSLR